MQSLKTAIVQSPALTSIDYKSDCAVYLSVDSSIRGIGWILAQDCSDGCRCPLCFSSISWNERESRYLQAKLELYGLFCTLHAMRLHLIGIRNLIVKVDASYIKGMLSNPDVQPNAAINQWIAAILLFDFQLKHVPTDKHKGPDGLSRREPAPGEEEDDDPEDWVDNALSLGTWVVSWLNAFPTNAHCTDALALSLETNEDSPQLNCPSHDRRLPAQYCTGDFVSTDTLHASRLHPLLTNASRIAPTPHINAQDSGLEDTINNNIINDSTNTVPGISNTNTIDNLNNNHIDIIDTASIIPQVPNTSNSGTTSNDTTPTKFLSSNKANKADAEIELIRQYLLSQRAPPNLPANALTRFISRAHHFLIAGGCLWRRQHHGHHQLYAHLSIRYALVHDAHDKLGHKGFYSTRCTLLDCFWWPALETDVKWFVQTCHQCQIRQTTKVCLLPTIVTPAPLFRRVHIDTMHMPLAGGFRYIV